MLPFWFVVAIDIDNLDVDPYTGSVPIDRELYLSADAEFVDLIVQIEGVSNGPPIGGRDDVAMPSARQVARFQARAFGGGSGLDARYDDAVDPQPGRGRFVGCDNADTGRRDTSIIDELRHDTLRELDWNREAQCRV